MLPLRRLLASASLALMLSACTDVPPAMIYVPPDMRDAQAVPPALRDRSPFRGRSLAVPPVTGIGSDNGQVLAGSILTGTIRGTAIIWSETFRQALIETLQDNRVFATVQRDGPARFVLSADILRQTPGRAGAVCSAHYSLTDTLLHRIIWLAVIETAQPPATTFGDCEFLTLMRACGRRRGRRGGVHGDVPPSAARVLTEARF